MTNLGATSVLSSPVAIGLVVVGALVLVVSRYSSLGSMVVAILLPVGLLVWAIMTDGPLVYVLHGLVSAGVALLALRPNIERLRQGTERKIGEAS
jgi:glycerol-3-phosphate acyltransferase PlsY